jgi:hypothetical protein
MKEYLKTIAVLKELGRLVIGKSVQNGKGGAGYDSIHRPMDRDPLWAYLPPNLASESYKLGNGFPMLARFFPDDQLDSILQKTNLIVFIGACDSDVLQNAQRRGAFCLVFEPDTKSFKCFLGNKTTVELCGSRTLFFVGDPDGWGDSVIRLLPQDIFTMGCPAILASKYIESRYPAYGKSIAELLEVLYFRKVIYYWEGQSGAGDNPGRKIARELFYDQQLHFYKNAAEYPKRGGIEALKGIGAGQSAIVVGAGPDLRNKIGLIRNNLGKAYVIAVNSALKPLLEAGIEPDFVVINDTSRDSARTLETGQRLKHCTLVSHVLSGFSDAKFDKKVLFGAVPDVIQRTNLVFYASVATTAFAFAKHLGCSRVVLVGIQLGSGDELKMSYAPGTLQHSSPGGEVIPGQAGWIKYPRLYPALDGAGNPFYTTANFLDAAYWFRDEIRDSGIEVVNTTVKSLVHGKNVVIDEGYIIPCRGEIDISKLGIIDYHNAGEYSSLISLLEEHLRFWITVRSHSHSMVSVIDQTIMDWERASGRQLVSGETMAPNPQLESSIRELISVMDESNVTYLMIRYPGFDYQTFIKHYSDNTPAHTIGSGQQYFRYALIMSNDFVKIVGDSLGMLRCL